MNRNNKEFGKIFDQCLRFAVSFKGYFRRILALLLNFTSYLSFNEIFYDDLKIIHGLFYALLHILELGKDKFIREVLQIFTEIRIKL